MQSSVPHDHDALLDVGAVVDERYRIERLLGEGGMGAVYRAVHVGLGRTVALKVLKLEWLGFGEVVRRFRQEARAASAIGHPNIIELLDTGSLADGRPYIAMEYLDGRTLYDELTHNGAMSTPRACRIGAAIAHALAATHAIGIVHRDLKAENVILVPSNDGEIVKVLDFGVSADLGDAGPRMTRPGLAVGTPIYMAPEQALAAPPTPGFDIYALGVVLFEMLSGQPPIDGTTAVEILQRKATAAPSLAKVCPDLPPALIDLVDRCLAIAPEQRPSDAAEIARVLERVNAEPTLPLGVPAPAVARRRVGAWIVGGCVVAGVLAAAIAWSLRPPADPTPTAPRVLTPAADAPPAPRPQATPPAAPPAELDTPKPVETPTPNEPTPAVVDDAAPASTRESKPKPRTTERPTTAPTPEPTPTPASTPAEAPAHASTACERERREAEDARLAADWRGMLRHTERAECWSSKSARQKLRVKASLELGRYGDCIAFGRDLTDPTAMSWVRQCELRNSREQPSP